MSRGYLIKGGTVYDGTGAPPVRADVRIEGRTIRAIGPNLPADGETIIDASGLLVAPGLIDLHVHVFSGIGLYSVDPPDAGLATGVTTMLDTGTAGALTYGAFERFVVPAAREDVYALLNISMIGVIQGHPDFPPYMGDLNDARHADVPSAVACIDRHPERILGMKVRLTAGLANHQEANERAGLDGVLKAARRTGRPCMIHHARSAIPLQEVLEAMWQGDIYTHLYHPNPDTGFDKRTGAPFDALRAARERGVILDVGHGVGAFAWRVAEPACQEHDFWPDTISTDIHQFNLRGPVFDLPTTMSKFLHLGMPLSQVIRATTHEPARAMGLADRFGRLLPGRQADLVLLRLENGRFELVDVEGQVRVARQRLVATAVVKCGQYSECQSARTCQPVLPKRAVRVRRSSLACAAGSGATGNAPNFASAPGRRGP
jgi:dihydroorotase